MKTLLGILVLCLFFYTSEAQTLLYENFSSASGTIPPSGWENILISGVSNSDKWSFDDPYVLSPLNSLSSDPFATFSGFFYSEDGIQEVAELISPVFDCSGKNKVALFFQEYFLKQGGDGNAQILVSVDNGSNWQQIYFRDGEASTEVPTPIELDISNFVTNEPSVQLKFKAVSNGSIAWVIDDITVIAGEVTPPEISHSAFLSFCGQGPYEIMANINHPIGISASNIIYKVNGSIQTPREWLLSDKYIYYAYKANWGVQSIGYSSIFQLN